MRMEIGVFANILSLCSISVSTAQDTVIWLGISQAEGSAYWTHYKLELGTPVLGFADWAVEPLGMNQAVVAFTTPSPGQWFEFNPNIELYTYCEKEVDLDVWLSGLEPLPTQMGTSTMGLQTQFILTRVNEVLFGVGVSGTHNFLSCTAKCLEVGSFYGVRYSNVNKACQLLSITSPGPSAALMDCSTHPCYHIQFASNV